MKFFFLTFIPMSLVALFVLIGGRHLAKEQQEERIPISKKRFSDFANSFRLETERLEGLYLTHLNRLAQEAVSQNSRKTQESMREIAGVKTIHIFAPRKRNRKISHSLNSQVPEIKIDDGKSPLELEKAFTLPETIFKMALGKGKWIEEKKGSYRVFYSRPNQNSIVAMLVDTTITTMRERDYLRVWSDDFIQTFKVNDELLSITQGDQVILSSSKNTPSSPASSFVPVRNSMGQWQIKAWDKVSTSVHYNTKILTSAILLATILLSAGIFLFFQQKRVLRLAANRVSFVNRVSHELGTPLTSIRLNLDLAQDNLAIQPETSQHRLKLVIEEVDRLARLVTNVLTFAQREQELIELKPTSCNAGELINDTLTNFKPALLRGGFQIETDISETSPSLIDGDALTQITGNLISNVEKYGASGLWISLSCKQEENTLTLQVQDKGPGIPKSKRDFIFTPFARVRQDTSEGSSGTGLGLSIARDLAQRMGGNLSLLDSEKGAHFELNIPCPPTLSPLKTGGPTT